jgi:ATP-binding cassette subfamily B (MDR/TAP) protein 1
LLAYGRATTAANELFVLIERKSEIDPFADTGIKPPSTEGNIEIEGVGFSYPSRPDVPVLQNFSLAFPAGKVTALVVSNAATSILLLLL